MTSAIRLRVLRDSRQEDVHDLPLHAALVVGRDRARADVVVSELYCSRTHLRIERPSVNRLVVHDLDTKSGTLMVSDVQERVALARTLAGARAELRIVHDGVAAALDPEGHVLAAIGGVRMLRGTGAPWPTDAILIVPGAIVIVEARAADTTATRAVAVRVRAPIGQPDDDSWAALADAGFEIVPLPELAQHKRRSVLPVLPHLELFQDSPRIPGASVELSGAGFALVARRLAEGLGDRSFAPIELVLRGETPSDLSLRTAAVVRRHGEVRYVERAVARESDIAAIHQVWLQWLALAGASRPRAQEPEDAARAERAALAVAVTTGGQVIELTDDQQLVELLRTSRDVDHLVDATSERPSVTRGGTPPEPLTPAEVGILVGYVARALDGGRAMRPEDYPNPFSSTPLGRRHAFKTMRMKVDLATERGRYRLFPTTSTSQKGGPEYAFAPRPGVTYCLIMLAGDLERARGWLRRGPP